MHDTLPILMPHHHLADPSNRHLWTDPTPRKLPPAAPAAVLTVRCPSRRWRSPRGRCRRTSKRWDSGTGTSTALLNASNSIFWRLKLPAAAPPSGCVVPAIDAAGARLQAHCRQQLATLPKPAGADSPEPSLRMSRRVSMEGRRPAGSRHSLDSSRQQKAGSASGHACH